MSWFWMNMPLAAVFFAGWVGIPLYLVLRHPTWGPQPSDSDEQPAIEALPEVSTRRPVLTPALEVDARL
ncbi:MAG TPA: hypothetical protein VEH05_07310 [Streptosporangiaceae bacterium]|nr:hypothetical protein [Streptosporangiaceae bacterium]